jgi:hypothetical protein
MSRVPYKIDGFDEACIGFVTFKDEDYLVYSETKMIDVLMKDLETDYTGAREYFEFNTLASLPYLNDEEGTRPIILDDWTFDLETYESQLGDDDEE